MDASPYSTLPLQCPNRNVKSRTSAAINHSCWFTLVTVTLHRGEEWAEAMTLRRRPVEHEGSVSASTITWRSLTEAPSHIRKEQRSCCKVGKKKAKRAAKLLLVVGCCCCCWGHYLALASYHHSLLSISCFSLSLCLSFCFESMLPVQDHLLSHIGYPTSVSFMSLCLCVAPVAQHLPFSLGHSSPSSPDARGTAKRNALLYRVS